MIRVQGDWIITGRHATSESGLLPDRDVDLNRSLVGDGEEKVKDLLEPSDKLTGDERKRTRETTTRTEQRAGSSRKHTSKHRVENSDGLDKETISDEELFEKLKAMVLRNQGLYLKVLRYEVCFMFSLDVGPASDVPSYPAHSF